MPFQTVRTSRLYRQVAAQIAGLIESGELLPGQRLPSERDLSVKLAVSRPTVREAMIALELEGLVEVRTGSGVYVVGDLAGKSFRLDGLEHAGASPLELIDARLSIEAAIARDAANHISDAELDRLAATIDTMAMATSRRAYQDADCAFHMTIAEATGNSVLVSIVEQLWQEMASPIFERISSVSGLAGEHEPPTIGEHRAVLTALAAGDGAAAAAAMTDHLTNVRAFLQRDWKQRTVRPRSLATAG